MPRRIFMVRDFARFARRNRIEDAALVELVPRADLGIVDADLGGGLVKLRLARRGEGRSGGYRTIVAYRATGNVFFLYGFAKNERENIDGQELRDLRLLGDVLMKKDADDLDAQVRAGRILWVEEGE